MTRKVFFSFHYSRDSVRAGQIRNSNVIKTNSIQTSDFIDKAKWEQVKLGGDRAIENWINEQLKGTSVTVVLIGTKTSTRKWVKYEIDQSITKNPKNGLLGIYIHKCPLFDRSTDTKGSNPFDNLYLTINGEKKYLSQIYKTYDWIDDNGINNLGKWIEEAATTAGR